MLLYLHVSNYALIDDAEVEFSEGLNILTGETGAGKSVLLGSISLALGAKAKADAVRQGAEFAFVELHFSVDNDNQREILKELDIIPEDDVIVIQKRITRQRSVGKICGVTVNSSELRAVADAFMDVYGQHDYQNLLKPSMHIEILDEYGGEKIAELKEETRACFLEYSAVKKEWDSLEEDSDKRSRDIDFLQFQLKEIDDAALKPGEEEELKEYLKVAESGEKIAECLSRAIHALGDDGGALEKYSAGFRELSGVSSLTRELGEFEESLVQSQDILQSVVREMEDYLDSMEFDEERLNEARNRYDLISSVLMKYGRSYEKVMVFYDEKKEELLKLSSYEEYKENLKQQLDDAYGMLSEKCEELTKIRKKESKNFEKKIREALADLNFSNAEFEVRIDKSEKYSAKGGDDVSFYISTNKGEALMPLCEVASGGELSRIMLAIKTVSAGRDLVNTLIFDEIDAGISGNTAWKVAEKLAILAKDMQVICITHLPQIAAMADTHFEIRKTEENGHMVTDVHKLTADESLAEMTRLLGGAEDNTAAKENARALKKQAADIKKK